MKQTTVLFQIFLSFFVIPVLVFDVDTMTPVPFDLVIKLVYQIGNIIRKCFFDCECNIFSLKLISTFDFSFFRFSCPFFPLYFIISFLFVIIPFSSFQKLILALCFQYISILQGSKHEICIFT